VKVVGKSGRTNGSLSAMVGTTDGKHQLTFNANGDWMRDEALYANVIEAEFCGRIPAPAGTPSAPAERMPDVLIDQGAWKRESGPGPVSR
jgi:D-alanyl-D-alanine carboxypeptidase